MDWKIAIFPCGGTGVGETGKRCLFHETGLFACWWQAPKPPLNSPVPGLAARSCGTLLSGRRPDRTREQSALVLLPGGPFLLFLLAQDTVHVGLDGQQLPHLIPCLSVVGVGGFFSASKAAYSAWRLLTVGSFFSPSPSKYFFAA